MLPPTNNNHRLAVGLDGLWQFRVQLAGDRAEDWHGGFDGGSLAAVPAAFNEQFTDYDTFNHMGVVWYAREFELPPPPCNETRWRLHFGAVNYAAEVFLDGQKIGEHTTGHTPFECPLPPGIRHGSHRVVVRIDCALTPSTVPQGGFDRAAIPGLSSPFVPSVNFDFFPYSGILRPVHLCGEPMKRLTDVRVLPAEPEGSDGLLEVSATASDPGACIRFTVEETGDSAESPPGKTAVLRIRNPQLWNLGKPNLYHLRAELIEGGGVMDSFRRHFGFRSVRIDGDRFLLNGRPVYFQGFGRHEDMPVAGRGFCEAYHVRDVELLRWCGGNSFRTAHYPHAPEFLDLADRVGILIIGESPAVSMIPSVRGQETLDLHIQTVREMIRRDAHHPSVVAWCLANEPHSHQPEALPYFEKVFAAAREEDSTRPMTIVMCRFPNEKCHHLCDFIGLNAYPGWYGGGAPLAETASYFSGFLDEVRAITRKPVLMTEFGADALAGLHSLPASLWTEDYQSELIRTLIAVLRSKDYIIGEHLWAFADFHTAQNHFRTHGNRKGVFTRDRQPKMAAHTLREIWKSV